MSDEEPERDQAPDKPEHPDEGDEGTRIPAPGPTGKSGLGPQAELGRILGDLGKLNRIGSAQLAKSNIGKLTGITDSILESQRAHEDVMNRQLQSWEKIGEAKRAERQRELDWQNGLLEQQRLTVEALTAMATAQDSDRKINIKVLWIAAASLLVGIVGVLIALFK